MVTLVAQPRTNDAGRWSAPGLAILTYGFRPFFLFGSLWAALAAPLWLAMLAGWVTPAGPFDPVRWHAHEMLFGYLAAIMAGFALTAVPNWTGRLPLSGLPLAALVALWLTGRAASALVSDPLVAMLLDGAFLCLLAAAIWREIVSGRNFRNFPIALIFSVMAIANLGVHLGAGWDWPDPLVAERLALAAATMLIALIGGRIVPSFTRNWLSRAGHTSLPAPFGRLDKAALLATGAAVLLWVPLPEIEATGIALGLAGVLNFIRLARWRGIASFGEPLVAILHVGYLWLAISLLLLGITAVWPEVVPASAALHMLTAAGFGTMTLAVMTRASLGHTGQPLRAGPATLTIYGLVTCGALLRVAAPLFGDADLAVITAGGLIWSSAFALFALSYGPSLLKPGAGKL